jgi:hypothetical protein
MTSPSYPVLDLACMGILTSLISNTCRNLSDLVNTC